MSTPFELLVDDLITTLVEAPSLDQRQAANILLARELRARCACGSVNYGFVPGSFELPTSVDNASGGLRPMFDRARGYYFNRGTPPGHWVIFGGVSVPQKPSPTAASDYAAVVTDVMSEGSALVAAVKAEVGDTVFTARHRELNDSALPGESHALIPINETLAAPDDGQFRFGPGTWHVQFEGYVYSRSDDNPVSIVLDLAGVPITIERVTSDVHTVNPDVFVAPNARSDVGVYVELDVTVSFAFPTVVHFGNGGSFEQTAEGILRVHH